LKKSLLIDPGVQKQLRALPRNERAEVVLKLLELGEIFGQPHRHVGLGIRKLRGDLFECRVGLVRRVLFRASSDALLIRFLGSHDEVQKYLRGN
jgi:mRNA-degrading endonuclease RelE of RelBE toxin-antitoxin system